jgi:predicted branched-subunit amino acid permease
MSKLSQYLSGVKISLPVILGYLPVAIAFAVMASEAGLSRLEIILMSTLVFAGGSQIMAIRSQQVDPVLLEHTHRH